MSLPALNWKKISTVVVGTSDSVGVLNAIYTALTSVVYYDGATRTPGTGSAHTVSRYQNVGVTEAVYGTPPVNGGVGSKWILASSAGTLTPPLAAGVSFYSDEIYGGICKNAGAFSSWDAANPFTSGSFSRYTIVVDYHNGAYNYQTVTVYESKEAIAVVIKSTNVNRAHVFFAGAILTPITSAVGEAESDGRLYGMVTSGTIFSLQELWTDNSMFRDFNGQTQRFLVFEPGTSDVMQISLNFTINDRTTTSLKTIADQECYIIPIFKHGILGYMVGKGRDFAIINRMIDGTILSNSGNDIGYVLSANHSNTSQDSLALLA